LVSRGRTQTGVINKGLEVDFSICPEQWYIYMFEKPRGPGRSEECVVRRELVVTE